MIARLFHASTREVWCRVLYDEQHKRNNARDADILPSCKGSRWSYTGNGSWWLVF